MAKKKAYLTPQAQKWDKRGDWLFGIAEQIIGDESATEAAKSWALKASTEARGFSKLAIAWDDAKAIEEMARLKARLDEQDAAAGEARELQ